MPKGDMLLFVPNDLTGRLIDMLSGGYGYSHTAVDMGNGKIIEATLHDGVISSPIGKYGERQFFRVNISDKIDTNAFLDYLKGKIGVKYDILELITFGLINDPEKFTCSSLIASYSEMERLGLKGFVSPNDLAKTFGAPDGNTLKNGKTSRIEALKKMQESIRQQLKELEGEERNMDKSISTLLDEYNKCTASLPPFDPKREECDKIENKILELYHKKEGIYGQESKLAETLADIEKQINEIISSM